MFVWSWFCSPDRRFPQMSCPPGRRRACEMPPMHFSNAAHSRLGTLMWTLLRRHLSVPAGALCLAGWTGASRPLRIKWDVR
jgi:hypothetical protein